jgi:hypothetical protein
MRFKEAQRLAEEKGWRLEKITGEGIATHRYRHYKTGYVVFDGEACYRWTRLGDFVINCLEDNRWIDGFLRRN